MTSEIVNREFLTGYMIGPSHGGHQPGHAIQRALALYRSVRLAARLGELWARLRNVENMPLALPDLGEAANQHALGVLPVPIAQIRGSEGRCCDFDAVFRPIGKNTKDRWVRIATLVFMNVYLPAIELFQVDEIYYVRDGNHRVSVFQALEVQFIDANVTQLTTTAAEVEAAALLSPARRLGEHARPHRPSTGNPLHGLHRASNR